MVIRTVIVEDEPLARQTLRDFIAEIEWLTLVGEASDGCTAIKLIDELRPDFVLLDVQMPELSGLEVIKRIEHQPIIVFTTAYDLYAVPAFELEALDYLLKPFGRARFQAAMERVRHRFSLKLETSKETLAENARAASALEPKQPLTRLFVRERDYVVPLQTEDISRFEADDDYVRVHACGRSFLIHLTLTEIEARLDPTRFCRIHRSMIVNLDHIKRVATQDRRLSLQLHDGAEVVASRAGSQLLRELIF